MQVPVQLGDDIPGQEDSGERPDVAAEDLMSFLSEFRSATRAQEEAARQAAIKARRPSTRAAANVEPDPTTEQTDATAEKAEPARRSYDDLPWTTAAPEPQAPTAQSPAPEQRSERRRFGRKRGGPAA